MIVFGTAGHIDHGKSSIVRRLTGTDPDRLPEEKARGMTIDLGFAFMNLPTGQEIAFVDVPGHERFVKNMIAGAGGIDAVLMVVAADDGWMPQSQEHFQITRLLGTRTGLIIINKCDLVDNDWLELLEAEIREKVAGSFLEEVPIVKVSAQTGIGFEGLVTELSHLADRVTARKNAGQARLYADRAFVRQGIGQVVTGTLRGGSLRVGQTVTVWPSMQTGKVRTLQSSGHEVEQVAPGARTAVSLTGVDRKYMVRGAVILSRSNIDYFADRQVLALKVELLNEAPISVEDRRRILMIVGSTEVEGEVRLFDQKQIDSGQTGTLFFKPDEPLFSLVGDHFVFRLVTPMVTLGGGVVLDHLEQFPRRKQLEQFDYLNRRLEPSLDNLLISELEKLVVSDQTALLHQIETNRAEIDRGIKQALENKTIGQDENSLYHIAKFETVSGDLIKLIDNWFKQHPHEKGLPVESLNRLVEIPHGRLQQVLDLMVSLKMLTFENERYNLLGRGLQLKGAIKEAHDEIIRQLTASPFQPPALASLAALGKHHKQAIKFILDTNEAYKCGSDYIFLPSAWDEIIQFIRDNLSQTGQLTPSDLRDRFQFSRKWVIPILEETDRLGLTERQGDIRVKGANFA